MGTVDKCSKCEPVNYHWSRCAEHRKCDDCGTDKRLCCYSEGLLCFECRAKRCAAKIAEAVVEKYDHELTEDPVCPYCGEDDHMDASEWGTSGDHQCSNCDRVFEFQVEYHPEWSTWKKES